MLNLMALVLIGMAGAQPLAPAGQHLQARPAASASRPEPRPLSPQQKAWFARAIDQILTGREPTGRE